jgi:hypothetical protein
MKILNEAIHYPLVIADYVRLIALIISSSQFDNRLERKKHTYPIRNPQCPDLDGFQSVTGIVN